MRKVVIVLAMIFFLAGMAYAARVTTVKLAWTASTSTQVTGYKIYYGAATGQYTVVTDAKNVLTYSFQNLPAGNYFFAATAYDQYGNESGFSNEVSWVSEVLAPPTNLLLNITVQ
jgi:hypothetical protein